MKQKQTDVAYFLVLSDLTRYALPRTQFREQRVRSRAVQSRRSPGARAAFKVGDLAWTPGEVRLLFAAYEDSNASIDALLKALRDACDDAVFIVREANTNVLTDGAGDPITDGDGDPLFASVGYGIRILSWSAGEATEYLGGVDPFRAVSLTFLAEFGEPTDGTPDTLAAYDAYDKEF